MVDVIVVGGGAAGLMAAGQAAGLGKKVVLIEKNDLLGRKLRITGKGRCNITNHCDNSILITYVLRNQKFLYSAFSAFSSQDAINFFQCLGLPLKEERGRRVFPKSDRASDVVLALKRFCEAGHVKVMKQTVQGLVVENHQVEGVTFVSGESLLGKAVILATGGLSYQGTGSTGDGYRIAREAGHTIVPPKPSLVPIVMREDYGAQLQGLSLKNVKLTVRQNGQKHPVYFAQGELLFTHFGISGPLVLAASAHMNGDLFQDYQLELDLKPALTPARLEQRLLREIMKKPNSEFITLLRYLLPKKFIPLAAKLSNIPLTKKLHLVTKEDRARLILLLKEFTMHPASFRPIEEAVITAGGVDVHEVNPGSMESKLCQGLYFAGELLDVDGYTGGYNLQIAWSTGYLAGRSAVKTKGDRT